MTAFAKIFSGKVRKTVIRDKIFPIVKNFNTGKKGTFITVDASQVLGEGFSNTRVYTDPSNVSFVSKDDYLATLTSFAKNEVVVEADDETRMAEIGERFEMLDIMTKAMMKRRIRGLVVSGPPGVGKSYGVEQEISKMTMFTDLAGKAAKAEMVRGAMSPRGLYEKLYEFSDSGSVVVFDDCDSVLEDMQSLNLLKSALDSSASRYITWASDRIGRDDGPPNRFEFKGSVMFITNMNFDNVRGKTAAHMDALMSRCHYLDLTLDTMRDKVLRVKQIAATGALFQKYERKYEMTKEKQNEILAFMYANTDNLREVSLRMALKIADCWVINENKWEQYAKSTCFKKSA